jgi:hypothetical protein
MGGTRRGLPVLLRGRPEGARHRAAHVQAHAVSARAVRRAVVLVLINEWRAQH